MKIQRLLDSYVSKKNSLYSLLESLNRTKHHSSTDLYEARNNTEYIISAPVERLVKTGRINLNGYKLESIDDVVVLSKMINSRAFETTRVLYVKNGVIVGQDAVTIDLPSACYGIPSDKKDLSLETYFQLIRNKAEKLGADSIYHIHNHPSGNSGSKTPEDETNCRQYKKYLPDLFKCAFIIGDDNITQLEADDNYRISRKQVGDFKQTEITISTPEEVSKYLFDIDPEYDCSYVIYVDALLKVLALQKISNVEFEDKNILNYIKNEVKRNGAAGCFLYTEDEDLYNTLSSCGGKGRIFTDVLYGYGDHYYKSASRNREFLDEPQILYTDYKAKRL